MQIEAKRRCDFCQKEFEIKSNEARGSLCLDNGTKIMVVGDVCRKCADKVMTAIGVQFPQARISERQYAAQEA